MSSLARILQTKRHRRHVSDKGGLKTPMMMMSTVPGGTKDVIITLRSGELYRVRVADRNAVRSGFFELPPDAEGAYFAEAVRHLYQTLETEGGVNVGRVRDIGEGELRDVAAYFKSRQIEPFRVVTGMLGYALMVLSSSVELPEQIDVEDITEETLKAWMTEHLCVGMLRTLEIPVFFDPCLEEDVVIVPSPSEVGMVTRVGDYVSIMVHGRESMVILRAEIEDVSG